ncbi:MAG: CoA-binding protein [Candidatus Aminicenantes bacterium]|nr:CoA-binding protein [Candidatus Aminicenantes bacterium]
MNEAHEILTKYRTFAVVGVSQNKEKYGYEVFASLLGAGYSVYPINPKYEVVDDHLCYPSLRDLPEKPDVVVTLVPPALTEKVVETCAELKVPVVWMPPGSWSDLALSKCRENGLLAIHDVCLVFALRSLPFAKA